LLEQIDYCPKKEHKKIPPKTQNEVREGIQNMIVQPAETSFFLFSGFSYNLFPKTLIHLI